jgi:hypothetical protein
LAHKRINRLSAQATPLRPRALAIELRREERTVRRWVTGDHAPPAEVITALRALMLQRADLIKKTAKA